ncbi:hypothetical protein MM440_07340 [Arsenicicoccus piscis]|uniref:Lipopolysaccharide assembly protein A domain-containing protein n=1 Tax=Arsenicicoccus piscis TaxID=673954 RepID=A0ABQ6HHZ6_9MICO|nr:hypothetical protein [Arsenicicoccus piscis]MCH8627601.1 hypothetical protein [Arsenicicoccus piscis]GMA18087.1 hypothetical protein GCM10025862_01080 [Arsenicicoccus piscis]
MIVIGLLLVLLAVVLGVVALFGLPTGTAVAWTFLGNTVSISPVTIFFAGAAAMLALMLGLWSMSIGSKRKARQHSELRALRKEQKQRDKLETQRPVDTRTGYTDRTADLRPEDRTTGRTDDGGSSSLR